MLAALLFQLVTAQAAQPNPYLDQAKGLYQQVQYERCVDRLKQAVRWRSSLAEQVEIELYAGLCEFNLGRTTLAEERFEMAVKLDRAAKLPPYSPPKAVALFEKVAERTAPVRPTPAPEPEVVRPEPKPPPDAPLTAELAPRPRTPEVLPEVTETKGVPGWVPLSLGGGALVLAGVGLGLNVMAQSQATEANAEPFEQLAYEKGDRARATATGSYVVLGVAGALAVSAVTTWLLGDAPVSASGAPSSSR